MSSGKPEKQERACTGAIAITALAVLVCSTYGYLNNVISLASKAEPTGLVVARAIGVFLAPLGIVLGYF